MPSASSQLKRLVVGRPFQILLILTLGGLAYLYLTPWVAAAVVVLLAVVVLSYRQVVRAYPSGGGSYEVVSKNLGAGVINWGGGRTDQSLSLCRIGSVDGMRGSGAVKPGTTVYVTVVC